MAPEFVRLIQRATAIVEGMGVIHADLDAGAVRQVGDATQATVDLI